MDAQRYDGSGARQPQTDGETSLIYHYTSAAGLMGIMGRRQLWLSDTQFLNDSSEVRYAAGRVFDELMDEGDIQLADLIKSRYLGEDLNLVLEDNPLVACFCRNGDLLSMWRGYADGGFSIGFDRHVLESLLTSPSRVWGDLTDAERESMNNTNFSLRGKLTDVVYGDVSGVVKALREHHSPSQIMTREFTGVKHPAFSEEQETRLLVFAESCMVRPNLREADGRLIPYSALEFPYEAVRSITVGPGPHQSRNYIALHRRYRKYGSPRGEWGHVEVIKSSTPFV